MNSPQEMATKGLNLIERAVLEFISISSSGASNAEIAKELNLESDIDGKHKNYLTWSVLGNLVNKGLIVKKGYRKTARYFVK